MGVANNVTERFKRGQYVRRFVLVIGAGALALTVLAFWYFHPWALEATLRGHQGAVVCLAFAPDGGTLATGGADQTIRLWHPAARGEPAIIRGHTDKVSGLAFSSDGHLLASCAYDGTVRLWELPSRRLRRVFTLEGPDPGDERPKALTVALSPDSEVVVCGDSDGTVKSWELRSGKAQTLLRESAEVRDLTFLPDGKLLAARTMVGTGAILDWRRGTLVRRFGEWVSANPWHTLVVSPDGQELAGDCGVRDKVEIWNVHTGSQVGALKAEFSWQDSNLICMALSPDGRVLVGATLFGARLISWDFSTRRLLGSTRFFPRPARIAFSPDGRTLASIHYDGSVRLWNAAKLIPR